MIDDVDAFVKVADILKERGAYKVLVIATHGVLSSDAPRLIEDSNIDEVVNIYKAVLKIGSILCYLQRNQRHKKSSLSTLDAILVFEI